MKSSRTLLVGTNNSHKAGEISAMLADLDVRVVTPRDLDIADEPVENGATFEENARIKARFYAEASGLPCLADDSGLVVDALGGRPGVYSSRYAPTDPERIARLLGELEGVSDAERAARFVCAAALVISDAQSRIEIVKTGTCEGRIAQGPRGENGFGYDPIFYQADLGKTLAEIPAEVKNARSHRGRALQAMRPDLENLFGAA